MICQNEKGKYACTTLYSKYFVSEIRGEKESLYYNLYKGRSISPMIYASGLIQNDLQEVVYP